MTDILVTNILQIPLLDGSITSFALTTNSQWVDQISFIQPGFPASFSIAACGLTSGSNIVTSPTTALIIPGMTLAPGPGIPFPVTTGIPILAYVLSITSPTTFTVGDALGNVLNATATNPAAILTFNAPPLDLSNISFISSVAQAGIRSPRILLTAQTSDGTLINGKTTGILQYNVGQAQMAQLLPGIYALDIIAYDGTYTVNLFPQGPASVTVSAGVSTTALAL